MSSFSGQRHEQELGGMRGFSFGEVDAIEQKKYNYIFDADKIDWGELEKINEGRAHRSGESVCVGNVVIINWMDDELFYVDGEYIGNYCGFDLQEVVEEILPYVGKTAETVKILTGFKEGE